MNNLLSSCTANMSLAYGSLKSILFLQSVFPSPVHLHPITLVMEPRGFGQHESGKRVATRMWFLEHIFVASLLLLSFGRIAWLSHNWNPATDMPQMGVNVILITLFCLAIASLRYLGPENVEAICYTVTQGHKVSGMAPIGNFFLYNLCIHVSF